MNDADAFHALKAREPIFHRPEFGTGRADFERMTDERFWQVGASGAVYDRALVLDELERRYSSEYRDEWAVSGFSCRALGNDLFLVTYRLDQGARRTQRCTLWRLDDGEWKALYHQGTLVT